MKSINWISFILLIVSLNLNLVDSLGVGALYSGSEFPLEMHSGEEKTIILELQNWDVNEELSVEGKILKGNEIAFLKNNITKVPYQVKVFTEMIIKIPAEAKAGEKYNIEYEFKQVSGKGEGMVSFNQGMRRNFDVVIVSEVVPGPAVPAPAPKGISTTTIVLLIVGIIVVIVIIVLLIKRKK